MPKGQLKRAKRLKKGPKNPFLNLKNKKSVFRRVVKRLNTEKSKKITERGKGKNHGRLRLFAQPRPTAQLKLNLDRFTYFQSRPRIRPAQVASLIELSG